MKDIHIKITVKQQKREIIFAIASLFMAVAVNALSILRFGTEWKELYTQWLPTFIMTAIFYFGLSLFRYFWGIVSRKISKNN